MCFILRELEEDKRKASCLNCSITNRGNRQKFSYFGTIVTNQNYINDEVKIRLNLASACQLATFCLSVSCVKE